MSIKKHYLIFFCIASFALPKEHAYCQNFIQHFTDSLNQESHFDTSEPFSFHYQLGAIDNSMGLSNSSLNTIFQDSQGLMWFGSYEGLNWYDGKKIEVFTPQLYDENCISNQVIEKVGEDKDGKIWILTMYGINSFDKKTGKFRKFIFSQNDSIPLPERRYDFAIDNNGIVFIGVSDNKIAVCESEGLREVKFDDDQLDAGWETGVKKMKFTPDGHLWILTFKDKLYRLRILYQNGSPEKIDEVNEITSNADTFENIDNTPFILKNSGKVYKYIDGTGKGNLRLVLENIQNFIGTGKNEILVKNKRGYGFLNQAGGIIHPPWISKIRDFKIRDFYEDREHTLWFATDGEGILKLYKEHKAFNTVSATQVEALDKSIVRAFEKDGRDFYVGTKGRGLIHFGNIQKYDKWHKYEVFSEKDYQINNNIFALQKVWKGVIAIGSDGEGIQLFDKRNNTIIPWKDIAKDKNLPFFRSVYDIYIDKGNTIWIATSGYGLIRFRLKKNNDNISLHDFKQYTVDNYPGLGSNIIHAIEPNNGSGLWLGTRLGGLRLFNRGKDTFKGFYHVKNDSTTLSNDDILFLKKSNRGDLWIGTSLGLNKMKYGKDGQPVFERYTMQDGLPNNTIHGFAFDKKDNPWIITNMGLSCFDGEENKFINYTQSDDLQNNEFGDGAIFTDMDTGMIFAGGIQGFNYFKPENVQSPSKKLPDVYINEIRSANSDEPYYRSFLVSAKSNTPISIVLKHDQNFFDMEMSAVTYVNQDKIKYAYQLENFEENWNSGSHISYKNVPSGTYSLLLRWTNRDGVWSRPAKAMEIEIKPIIWKSNLAYAVYFILGGGLIWFLHSYYKKKQTLKQNLIFQKKEEEIHQNRLAFFTNIAHELQTPLTLIVGPSQKLSGLIRGSKESRYLKMIQSNSSRLLFLTQQLLEFRKAEYDHLDVSVRYFDVVPLIKELGSLFDEWAVQKNIRYAIQAPDSFSGWYDKDKIEKIIFNLLSNAFKYTPPQGKIKLIISISNKRKDHIKLRVVNTGKGIPKEKIDRLFDRFASSDILKKQDSSVSNDNEIIRTGIGLAYIKKLVKILKGEIKVKSKEGKKTKFTIFLPYDKENFSSQQISTVDKEIHLSSHLRNVIDENLDFPDKTRLDRSFNHTEEDMNTVLLVEDDLNIHNFIKSLLKDKYKVVSAYNGADALRQLQVNVPEIIVSDIMMDEMDGIELCRQLKNNRNTCQIPFVILTAKDSYKYITAGMEYGADAYISKPFNPDDLFKKIEELLLRNKMVREQFFKNPSIITSIKIKDSDEDKDIAYHIINLIQNNIDNEDLITLLENELGMSSSTLYRTIKHLFEETPAGLIRSVKLKYAALLLKESSLSISEICYRAGFNNKSYFFREFKKKYHASPRNYKNQHLIDV